MSEDIEQAILQAAWQLAASDMRFRANAAWGN